jgi:hypothetical protein
MPSMWSLFQAIERANQTTIVIRFSRISKTRRLSHIDLLIKKTIQKGVLNIKLSNMPLTRKSDAKDKSDSRRLDHRTECLIIIQTILLFETFGN